MASHNLSTTRPSSRETGSSSLVSEEGREAPRLAEARFSGLIDYRELRHVIGMADVLALLGWEAATSNGPQRRGPCPIHRSKSAASRSLSVHVEKHVFRCFGCGKKGNQLDLFAQAIGLPVYLAAEELCRRMGVAPPRLITTVQERLPITNAPKPNSDIIALRDGQPHTHR